MKKLRLIFAIAALGLASSACSSPTGLEVCTDASCHSVDGQIGGGGVDGQIGGGGVDGQIGGGGVDGQIGGGG